MTLTKHGAHARARTTHQVSDRAKIDELIHLQIVQSAWSCDHYVDPTFHHMDLSSAIAAPVDTDTARREEEGRVKLTLTTLCSGRTADVQTFCSLCSCTCCTRLRSGEPALWWESAPTYRDHPGQLGVYEVKEYRDQAKSQVKHSEPLTVLCCPEDLERRAHNLLVLIK